MKLEGSDIVFSAREAQLSGITSFPISEFPDVYTSMCAQRDVYEQLACGPNGPQNYANFQYAQDLHRLTEQTTTKISEVMVDEADFFLRAKGLE
jgi:hypothetical protein